MTTITFASDIKIKKSKFKDIDDFRKYIEESFCFTELKKVPKSEVSLDVIKKMNETKKLIRSQKKLPGKVMTEPKFWQQIALEQQAILHAKHNT